MAYIDIFAGCGGLSVGLYNAGLHGLFAIEKNKDAFSTLKYNLIDKKNTLIGQSGSLKRHMTSMRCLINIRNN